MEEYIKVKDLIDMLEKRLVFQEEHGFYRDAGYTSRFIESISDMPCEDVVAKSEYDKLQSECTTLLNDFAASQLQIKALEKRLARAETETAKRIFDDIFNSLPYRQNCYSQDIEFGYEWGLVEAGKAIKTLKKKYKVED